MIPFPALTIIYIFASKNRQTNTEAVKIIMTPDEFFPEYMKVCFAKNLARLTGTNYNLFMQRVRHDAPHGREARFLNKHIPDLNHAISIVANKIASMELTFRPSPTSKKGKWIDKKLLRQFQKLGEWVHIKSITMEALGWNKLRYNNIISISSSRIYGHITAEDCDRINIALKKVAAFLGSVELVVEDEKKFTSVENKMVLLDSDLDLLEEQLLLGSDLDME